MYVWDRLFMFKPSELLNQYVDAAANINESGLSQEQVFQTQLSVELM